MWRISGPWPCPAATRDARRRRRGEGAAALGGSPQGPGRYPSQIMAQTVLRGKPCAAGPSFGTVTLHAGCTDNHACEADQTAAGASAERRPWRKVRTAQGGAAANGCPPRGEDQSNRDESGRASLPGVLCGCRRQPATGRRKPPGHGDSRGPHSHPDRAKPDPGETGNLCAQQHRIGTRRSGPGSVRVGGIEPAGRPPAQRNGGHARRRRQTPAADAQNPAYRSASQHLPAPVRPDRALPHAPTIWFAFVPRNGGRRLRIPGSWNRLARTKMQP